MTARSRKKRDRNNRIKRAANKIKELKRLKKTLGLLDEDSNIMDVVKDITTQQDPKMTPEMKQMKEEIEADFIAEKSKDIVDPTVFIEVENEKTKVVHKFNTTTMKDQFGGYPVWYKARKEKVKKMQREGKIIKRRGRPGKKAHFIDRTCNWKNILGK